jgi:hypothetical protein
MDAVADMVVKQHVGRRSFVGFHWVVQDLKHRTSRTDLSLRIVDPHKIVGVDTQLSMKSEMNRNGSYRTAKGPSYSLRC